MKLEDMLKKLLENETLKKELSQVFAKAIVEGTEEALIEAWIKIGAYLIAKTYDRDKEQLENYLKDFIKKIEKEKIDG